MWQLQQLYPRHEAQALLRIIVEDICHVSWTHFVCDGRSALGDSEPAFQQALNRLLKGEPIQYITGRTTFCRHEFVVSPATLIPRPETEDLVDWIVESCDAAIYSRLLDIGTGSGCLAISLALALNGCDVTATDISAEALQIAHGNWERLCALQTVGCGQTSCVRFVQHDILSSEPVKVPPVDVIVSNPPYIPLSEQRCMHTNVVGHEPHNALFVPDADPLLFYHNILRHANGLLRAGGYVFFEIHPPLADKLYELLLSQNYTDITFRNDRFDRRRMLRAKKCKKICACHQNSLPLHSLKALDL